MLKIEFTGSTDRQDMGREKIQRDQDNNNTNVFNLSKQEKGVAINEGEEPCSRRCPGAEYQELDLGHRRFEMPSKHPCGTVR